MATTALLLQLPPPPLLLLLQLLYLLLLLLLLLRMLRVSIVIDFVVVVGIVIGIGIVGGGIGIVIGRPPGPGLPGDGPPGRGLPPSTPKRPITRTRPTILRGGRGGDRGGGGHSTPNRMPARQLRPLCRSHLHLVFQLMKTDKRSRAKNRI